MTKLHKDRESQRHKEIERQTETDRHTQTNGQRDKSDKQTDRPSE